MTERPHKTLIFKGLRHEISEKTRKFRHEIDRRRRWKSEVDIRRKSIRLIAGGVIVLTTLLFATTCSKAFGSSGTEAHFKGQVLRIIVGRTPGGSHDMYARAMAQYFGRHVPGHPTVVVENMPGAGGLLALKYLAHQARPDGLTIGQVGVPGAVSQFTDDPESQAASTRVLALGSPSDDVPVCVFSRPSHIDLDKWRTGNVRPRLGVTGYGTPSHINTVLMSTALQLPAQIVAGYKGTAEIRQAIASREVDGTCIGLESYLPSFEPKDDYLVALQLEDSQASELAGVPSLTALVTDPRGKELIRVARLIGRISRFYAVPAATPTEVVSLLRNAFDDTMRDAEFLQVAKLANLPISPIAWNAVDQSVAELLQLPPDARDRVSAILKPPTR
jgi:tripartite-type tricarboxylate transporter receptor subunit TctC